ncbi:MAG: hypothetical protein K8T10_09990 [Candidatus Eremiobacteraeota bacterium]|nr:hypothetical protein [Candidatus Eremiobacteraeota bacterium]
MKNTHKTFIFLTVLGLVLIFLSSVSVHAQLVMSEQKMKIVKVEREFNRLQARVHEDNKGNVQYILVDGNTKFSHNNREVSFNKAWKMFRKDMIIRVKGGVTITGKIKAKQIWW